MKISIIFHSETGNVRKMAELIKEGCRQVKDIECRCMEVDNIDNDFLADSSAVILGSPTYEASCSWHIKKFLDTCSLNLEGKLGAVFASQGWPGGGGASFAEMTMIAGMLVHGMLIYSGGKHVSPFLHFGAVSNKGPDEELYRKRCITLGETIANKAKQIF